MARMCWVKSRLAIFRSITVSSSFQAPPTSPSPPPSPSPSPSAAAPKTTDVVTYKSPITTTPLGFIDQSHDDRLWIFCKTNTLETVSAILERWESLHEWISMKKLFDLWVQFSYNVPDVKLINYYLKAKLMTDSSSEELVGVIHSMNEAYGIVADTSSFNLVLESMDRAREIKSALMLLSWMIKTGKECKECLPDEESYSLVIRMLLEANLMALALKCMDLYLNSGYLMSQNLFIEYVRYCARHRNVDMLNTVINRCKERNQDLRANWFTCIHMIKFASQVHDSVLAYYALECIEKCMMKRLKEAPYASLPPSEIHVLEDVLVYVIQIAGRTGSNKLLNRAWRILMKWNGIWKVSSFAYIARLHAHASFGQLGKAFDILKELESSYGGSSQEDAHLFSPFSTLYPLVEACSWNGCETLDKVYYHLEYLSKENPPYKSIAALNCIILGCANIWDDYRAEETFKAISTVFGLTPTIDSYNGLICAFGKLKRREEALKLFDHFKGLGIKANAITYALLIDAHLIARDQKSALSVIEDMVLSGFVPTRKILQKVRRRCIREMDTESDEHVNALAKKFEIFMPSEKRRNTLFNLNYTRRR